MVKKYDIINDELYDIACEFLSFKKEAVRFQYSEKDILQMYVIKLKRYNKELWDKVHEYIWAQIDSEYKLPLPYILKKLNNKEYKIKHR